MEIIYYNKSDKKKEMYHLIFKIITKLSNNSRKSS